MDAIDLFAGLGGFSTGATLAGITVKWAANHWQDAVAWHRRNHPETKHNCQDLQQADWSQVPRTSMLLAAPCCHGHTPARGKDRPHHDVSRSTAWAVVSAVEYHRHDIVVVENVPGFIRWSLYPAWHQAMADLGYQLAPHILDAADYGVPQHRKRLFIVATRGRHPLFLHLEPEPHIPARSFIDLQEGRWQPIDKPGRSPATLRRVRNGRKRFGDTFIMPFYSSGSGLTGRSLDRPIGTIPTRDRWAIVHGDKMRMINRFECRDGMSFPQNHHIPDDHRLAVHLLGNSVCPEAARRLLNAIREAA
ncbi:DNA-cytosine methyltransferase [Alcanivorax sp. S71-1-4]|uniref:DNA cytosine methyltransferase n=1 Tax=Alcanivorax sp. S71-1-4 TaxID=1177159 RepID=UPI00135B8886|nr:DNA cytosine methyltransferase [Alcanivorax sp. S71-1-4]KAF0810414.1 DNA-cytosine methyltransferase [Alcanivorax sp. S71-1-4]